MEMGWLCGKIFIYVFKYKSQNTLQMKPGKAGQMLHTGSCFYFGE